MISKVTCIQKIMRCVDFKLQVKGFIHDFDHGDDFDMMQFSSKRRQNN